MKKFPVITTLSPEQRIWLDKKLAEKGISSISKRKEEFIALILNGPVLTKEQIRYMKRNKRLCRIGA